MNSYTLQYHPAVSFPSLRLSVSPSLGVCARTLISQNTIPDDCYYSLCLSVVLMLRLMDLCSSFHVLRLHLSFECLLSLRLGS